MTGSEIRGNRKTFILMIFIRRVFVKRMESLRSAIPYSLGFCPRKNGKTRRASRRIREERMLCLMTFGACPSLLMILRIFRRSINTALLMMR